MISYESHESVVNGLSDEGLSIVQHGSHEARVWSALAEKDQGAPVTPLELKKSLGDEIAKVGQGKAFKNKWIGKQGDGLVRLVMNSLHCCLQAAALLINFSDRYHS